MKKGLLASALCLLGGSGLAYGQEIPVTGLPVCQEVPAVTCPRIWGSSEYLLWWVKGQNLSTPLVTSSTNPNATDANGNNVSGGLGRDGTSVLVGPGGQGIHYGALSGGRFTIGGWLNPEGTIGLEGRGFVLEQGSSRRGFSSNAAGSPVIGNPIIDTSGAFGGGENSLAVSFPGTFSGTETVISHTRLWGTEANGVVNFFRGQGITLDLLAGFRYVDLTEDVSVISQTTNLVPLAAGGGVAFLNNFFDGTTTATDTFRTRNQFYGGQIGARADAEFGRFFVNVTSKLALGSTHQEIDIRGYTTLQTAGTTAQTAGGIYALSSNIGHRTREVFSAIPEVEAKVGYKFTERLRGYVGYNFMYWSDVARPGQQFDRNVDVRQVPTVPGFDPTIHTQPTAQSRNSSFWAQGINVGLEFRY